MSKQIVLTLVGIGLGLSTQSAFAGQCRDIKTGPIMGQGTAEWLCPQVCERLGLDWNGQWKTIEYERVSVCGCCPREIAP